MPARTVPPATRRPPSPIGDPVAAATHAAATQTWRRRVRHGLVVVAVLAALATLGGSVPLAAQTDEIEAAKAEREAKAEEIAAAAAALDPLMAEDAELEAAVEALEANVRAQGAKLDATRQALASARDNAVSAADDVAAMHAAIDELRARVRAALVEAYVSPDAERVDSVLTSEDVTVAVLKRAMLETVSGNKTDLVDQLRAAEEHLVDLEQAAADAVAEVGLQEAAEAGQLERFQSALADELRLRDALQERIDAVHDEISALEAEQDQLTSLITGLIAEEEARQAAIAEAKRRAAEAARLAAQQAAAEAQGATPLPTLAPLPAPPSASGLVWPAQGVLSSPFGERWGRQHQGIDIAAPSGTPVVAAQAGVVLSAGTLSGYGQLVTIDHGDGLVTVYAHLSQIGVSAGQSVARGQQIGLMGCTGSCTGPHVHFETRVQGVAQDPMLYL